MIKFIEVFPTVVKCEDYKPHITDAHHRHVNLSNVEMIINDENCSYETGYFEITMIFNSGRVCVLQYNDYDEKSSDYLNIMDAMGL